MRLNAHAPLQQPDVIIPQPTVHKAALGYLSGRAVPWRGLALPSLRVSVTFTQARSYVASTIDAYVSERHTVTIYRAENGVSVFFRDTGIYLRVYKTPDPGGQRHRVVCRPGLREHSALQKGTPLNTYMSAEHSSTLNASHISLNTTHSLHSRCAHF
jgi:hypothetical protein